MERMPFQERTRIWKNGQRKRKFGKNGLKGYLFILPNFVGFDFYRYPYYYGAYCISLPMEMSKPLIVGTSNYMMFMMNTPGFFGQ